MVPDKDEAEVLHMIPWQRSTVATELDVARRIYSRVPMASQQLSASRAGGVLGGQSGNLAMRYGTAIADSADGWVNVHLDLAENESDYVVCICDSPISQGQRVAVLVTDSGDLKAIPIGDNILDDAIGQIGNPVVDTDLEWAGSDSGDTAPTDGWSQSWPSGSLYVWQRQRVEKKDGTVTYSTPVVVSKPQEGYDADATFYATSSSSSSTSAKTATVQEPEGFELKEGVVVSVNFTNANTASSPTLNVNSTGAKSIRTLGTSSAYWAAGQTVLFVYDGTYWQVASAPVWASTVTVGNPASRNVYVDGTHVAIRNGTTEYSTFDANNITLGRTNSGSMLRLSSDGTATFYDAGDESLEISADSSGATIATPYTNLRLENSGSSMISLGDTLLLSAFNGVSASRHLTPFTSGSGWVMNATLLYSGSTTGSVRLSMSSSSFWRIDIYFDDGSGRVQMASTCGSTASSSSIGSSCSGRSVSLIRGVTNSSSMYIAAEHVTISGSTISRGTEQQLNVTSSGGISLVSATFYIQAVIGWSI